MIHICIFIYLYICIYIHLYTYMCVFKPRRMLNLTPQTDELVPQLGACLVDRARRLPDRLADSSGRPSWYIL